MKTPLEAPIAAPAGTDPAPSTRLNVKVLAGRSASAAVAVNVISVSSSPDFAPIAARTGATLTSLTVTVIVSESVVVPSETTTSNV